MRVGLVALLWLTPGFVAAQESSSPETSELSSESRPAPPSQASAPSADSEDSIPLRQERPAERASDEPSRDKEMSDASAAAPTRRAAGTTASNPSGGREMSTSGVQPGDESDDSEESPQFGYFGIGPAMINIAGVDEYGFAMGAGGRFPFHHRMAINAGVTWGLTSFDRTGEWWEEARKIGRWTSRAYANVTEWAGEGEDDDALRYIAAFYAYVGLLFPYAVSGIMYIIGPFAATSYVDFHMEATFHLLETRRGPYVGAGLGIAAVIFPVEREMKGALGPSFNLGYDFGWFGIEGRGFYSPPYLHGEPGFYRTDVFTGQVLFRFQGK